MQSTVGVGQQSCGRQAFNSHVVQLGSCQVQQQIFTLQKFFIPEVDMTLKQFERRSRRGTRGEQCNTIACQGCARTHTHTHTDTAVSLEVTHLAGTKIPTTEAATGNWQQQLVAMAKDKGQLVMVGQARMGTVGGKIALICLKGKTQEWHSHCWQFEKQPGTVELMTAELFGSTLIRTLYCLVSLILESQTSHLNIQR